MIDWAAISLRPLADTDLPSLHAWQNDPALRDLVMGFRGPVQRETTADWLHGLASQNLRTRTAFAICQEATPLGLAQLHGIDWLHRTAALGLYIGCTGHRRKGLGFVAGSLLLDFAFNGLDLERVSLQVLTRNTVAVRLYERLGFQHEGVLRSAYSLNRRREDVSLYAILAGAWTETLPTEARRLLRDDVAT